MDFMSLESHPQSSTVTLHRELIINFYKAGDWWTVQDLNSFHYTDRLVLIWRPRGYCSSAMVMAWEVYAVCIKIV